MNIPKVYEEVYTGNVYYSLQEMIPGMMLRSWITSHAPLFKRIRRKTKSLINHEIPDSSPALNIKKSLRKSRKKLRLLEK